MWRDMPVRTESGEALGRLVDAAFDPGPGAIGAVRLSGRRRGGLGHRRSRSRVGSGAGLRRRGDRRVRRGGGGRPVGRHRRHRGQDRGGGDGDGRRGGLGSARRRGRAGGGAAKGAKTAAAYGKSAAKVAAQTETGKKAIGWLKAIRDEVADAMSDEDDVAHGAQAPSAHAARPRRAPDRLRRAARSGSPRDRSSGAAAPRATRRLCGRGSARDRRVGRVRSRRRRGRRRARLREVRAERLLPAGVHVRLGAGRSDASLSSHASTWSPRRVATGWARCCCRPRFATSPSGASGTVQAFGFRGARTIGRASRR